MLEFVMSDWHRSCKGCGEQRRGQPSCTNELARAGGGGGAGGTSSAFRLRRTPIGPTGLPQSPGRGCSTRGRPGRPGRLPSAGRAVLLVSSRENGRWSILARGACKLNNLHRLPEHASSGACSAKSAPQARTLWRLSLLARLQRALVRAAALSAPQSGHRCSGARVQASPRTSCFPPARRPPATAPRRAWPLPCLNARLANPLLPTDSQMAPIKAGLNGFGRIGELMIHCRVACKAWQCT